jgi:ATP-dependent Lhr-like helicase
MAGGRWSLVADLLNETPATQRLLARAQMLLERYGLVSRDAVQAEGIPGGFGPLYPVLKQMEEAGRVRRGYFVEGLSGAQFALAGAVERLRGARIDEAPMDGWSEQHVLVLAAADPTNPYGALLPWPEPGGGARPRRVGGAWAVLVAGQAALYLNAGSGQLQTFVASLGDQGGALDLALAALRQLPSPRRKRLLIRRIDDLPALESPLRESLVRLGFEAEYDGLATG